MSLVKKVNGLLSSRNALSNQNIQTAQQAAAANAVAAQQAITGMLNVQIGNAASVVPSPAILKLYTDEQIEKEYVRRFSPLIRSLKE